MAGKTPQQPQRRLANLTPTNKAGAIPRLEKRIQELEAFNPSQIHEGGDPRVTELQNSIARTLDQVFDVDTVERERYAGAHALDKTRVVMFMAGMPRPDHAPGLEQGKQQALSILRGIINGFK